MAGLIGLQASDLEIQDALGARRFEYEDWIPHPVVRLTTSMPIAVLDSGGNQRGAQAAHHAVDAAVTSHGVVIKKARWGFNVGAGRPIGNARDDRLQESPMWRGLLGSGHCVVAATAVYEQAQVDGKKTSLWFRRQDRAPILMPGLCGIRKVKDEARLCAAIVTTEPNAFFKQFHDRQVCTLEPNRLTGWLSADAATAAKYLKAPGLHDWEAVPVDDMIFKPGRREAEHLKPIADPIRWT